MLKVAPCSSKAAKVAVERWHYSGRLPVGRMRRYGVWENGEFKGVVIFSRGASLALGHKYGLGPADCCELARVALREHTAPVSRILRIALLLLKKAEPTMRLVVSFADPAQGHHGGIYQAGGWIFDGDSTPSRQFYIRGRWIHNREATSGAFGGACRYSKAERESAPSRLPPGKHRYLMWLTKADRKAHAHLAKPYPRSISTMRQPEEEPCAPVRKRQFKSDPGAPQ